MNRPSTPTTRRIAAGALAAITMSLAMATPAVAAAPDAPATATAGELGARLERACLRIPNIEIRTENLIGRLQAGGNVRLSLAWLQNQIDNAAARNNPDLVTVLENRLAVRQQTLEVLLQRQQELPRLKQLCIDKGVAL